MEMVWQKRNCLCCEMATLEVAPSCAFRDPRERRKCMQGYPTTPDPQQSSQQTPQLRPHLALQLQRSNSNRNTTICHAVIHSRRATPSSNRKKLLIGGGIGCGTLLVLCMCAGLLGAILSNGSTSANSGGSPTTTQQSQPQKLNVTPTPDRDNRSQCGRQRLRIAVTADSTILGADMTTLSDVCGEWSGSQWMPGWLL